VSLLNENPRVSDVLLYEDGEEVNYVRDTVTIPNGTAAMPIGTVLGLGVQGASSSATKGGGNTGTGTLTLDATTPELANVKPGVYTVTILATGRFQVIDPTGVDLGEMEFGSGATVTWADRIKFALADTSTHFVAGDGFTVTIAAGSAKASPLSLTAVDGTQVAYGVLLTPVPATLTADTLVVVLTRGPAVVKSTGLVWPAGASAPQIAAGIAQLQALGITTRTAYGV
jgi:hypothetical protein